MLILTHLLIICQSPEHHHQKGCLLASNQKADEIGEAAIGLLSISSEYRWNYDQNFIKIGVISLQAIGEQQWWRTEENRDG
jgi:hypothetical protein